jgi:hypothetical protein
MCFDATSDEREDRVDCCCLTKEDAMVSLKVAVAAAAVDAASIKD